VSYAALRRLARLLLAVFFRDSRVERHERLPADGPIVVCANHHGSLIDPIVLIAGLDRRLRPLAKAPLFSDRLLRPFLRILGALPVYRPQDRHLVEGDNRALIGACTDALAAGEAILVFPEGISKPTPALAPLRPGAARIALDAEAASGFRLGVRIVPVGIHLEQASQFRLGRVIAEIGEPIVVGDFEAAWRRRPEEASTALLVRLERELGDLVVDVESNEDLDLLRHALRAWKRVQPGSKLGGDHGVQTEREFARAYRALSSSDPDAVRALRIEVEAYARTLANFRLRGDEIDYRFSPGSVLAFSLRQGLSLLLAPFGLLGVVLNFVPYRLTSLIAARMAAQEDAWSSYAIGAGVAVFPAYWLAFVATTAVLLGLPWALLALALLPVSALWAIRFRDRQARMRRQIRAFFLLAGGGGLKRHLERSRQAIHDEIEQLRDRLGVPLAAEGGAECHATDADE